MNSTNKFFSKKTLTPIYQSENSECGLACLVMISNYLHSAKQTLRGARSLLGTMADGATFDDLTSISHRLGLLPKAVSLTEEEVEMLSLPAILHWNMNHFVVLEKISRTKFVIVDPVNGRMELTETQFYDQFTGVALELSRKENFVINDDMEKQKISVSDFFSSINGIKNALSKLILFSLITQVFAIGSPLYTQFTIDNIVQNGDTELLLVISIGIILIILLEQVILLFHNKLGLYISTTLEYQLSSSLLSHTLNLSSLWFKRRSVGDIMSKFGSLISIQAFITSTIIGLFIDFVSFIISMTIMLVYSPILTLTVILFLVFSHMIKLAIFPIQKNLENIGIIKSAKQESEFIESIRSFQTIKSLSLENIRFNRWINMYSETLNNSVKSSNIGFYEDFIFSIVSGIEYIVIIYICTDLISDGLFSIGMFFSFLAFKNRLVSSLNSIISIYYKKKILDIHLDRISDIALEKTDKNSGNKIEKIGSIELREVSLNVYNSDLLDKNVSLEIKSGDKVVITGDSGSGKTTLMHIICGNIRSFSGDILIDGISVKSIDSVSYKKHISSVFQDDVLFSGSIIENITSFDNNPDYIHAKYCSELAVSHEFIEKLPMKYETLIGDLGTSLSSGQKQRVMLARALYQRPSILVLDEATSFMDNKLEEIVLSNIESLGITVVAVAHRARAMKMSHNVLDFSSL